MGPTCHENFLAWTTENFEKYVYFCGKITRNGYLFLEKSLDNSRYRVPVPIFGKIMYPSPPDAIPDSNDKLNHKQ